MKRRFLAAIVLAVCLLPGAAFADDAATSRVEAKRREADGTSFFAKGDFGGAADAFGDAYQLVPSTKTLWNLAVAEFKAERFYAAVKHLRAYVAQSDASPKNLERAHALLEEAAKKVGHLVVSAPANVEVSVDGLVVGHAPLEAPVEVDPDAAHTVVIHMGNGESRQDVSPPGPHEVRVQLSLPERAPLLDEASAQTHVPVAPPIVRTRPAPLRIWLTVSLGAGAVALAAGGVYASITSSNAADRAANLRAGMPGTSNCRDQSYPGCADLKVAVSSQVSNHDASVVLFGGAGLLAAGAIVSWFVLPRQRTVVEKAQALPVVGPGMLGAVWAGSF
jgi:hypothetical protein